MSKRIRVFDEITTLILAAPEQRTKPQTLADGTFDAALELAYWRFDGRRAGNGKWAHPDGTRMPMAERDAFKAAVRELLAERGMEDK